MAAAQQLAACAPRGGVTIGSLFASLVGDRGLVELLRWPADVFALVGLVLGTFLAARLSKPTLPEPRVERAGSPLPPESSRSDRP